MTANHPVKPTITSRPMRSEEIRVLPWGVALMLFLIAFIIPFPNQVSSAADVFDQVRNICIEDPQSLDQGIPLTEPDSQGPPISLGCKFRDCGPSSTDPGPIEMRLSLTGNDVVDSILIEFTNLPPAKEKLITNVTTGAGEIETRDGSFLIPRGGKEVILRILPKLIEGGTFVHPDPRIKATLLLNKPFLQKHRGSPEFNQLPRHNWTATLEIEQRKGQVVVNEFKNHYAIRWCLSPQLPVGPHPFDQIKLHGATGSIKGVTLMISGRTQDECLKYKTVQGTDSLHLGNMLSKAADCQSNEMVIFSKDRRMHIATPPTDWTDATGDVREIQLPDKPVQVPVKFWILHKPEDIEISTLKRDLQDQLRVANELFGSTNACGIEFVATADSYQDVTGEAKRTELSDFSCVKSVDIRTLNKFRETAWKDSNAINVYYVSDVTHRGMHCGYGIFLSESREDGTLAHEFGHALGLDDVRLGRDALLNLSDPNKWLAAQRNLMFQGGSKRTELTKGQCFRCYMNETSKVRMLVEKAEEQWGKPRDCVGPKNNCIDIGETVTNPQ